LFREQRWFYDHKTRPVPASYPQVATIPVIKHFLDHLTAEKLQRKRYYFLRQATYRLYGIIIFFLEISGDAPDISYKIVLNMGVI